MYVTPLNTDLLFEEAQKDSLYLNLVEQLNKDFNLANEGVDFPMSITPDELKIELAVHLYEQRRLSIGHARELAGLSLWEFRQLLLSRRISPHYDVADLDEDMQTWAKLDNR